MALSGRRREAEDRRASRLHIGVIRTAAALRRRPVDVLGGILDVADFAVDAILRVDDEARVGAPGFVAVDDFVDAGGTIEPRRFAIAGQVVADRRGGIAQAQMDRLVLLVADIGQVDRRRPVERYLPVRLGIGDRRDVGERRQGRAVRLAMLQRASDRDAEELVGTHVEAAASVAER